MKKIHFIVTYNIVKNIWTAILTERNYSGKLILSSDHDNLKYKILTEQTPNTPQYKKLTNIDY